MSKIMRVNLSELKVKVEEMPKEYQGLGGRGLSSHIVGREVPPKTDPLGSENKLVFGYIFGVYLFHYFFPRLIIKLFLYSITTIWKII